MKKIIVLMIGLLTPNFLSAEAVAAWRVKGTSVILESSTNPTNPAVGNSAVIAIAYEKSFFRCKPSLALLTLKGLSLGPAIKKQSSSKSKNQLTVNVNNKKFVAENETHMNTYTNGVEVVAFFDETILTALDQPSSIIVSMGGGQALIAFRTTNSITPSMKQISGSC